MRKPSSRVLNSEVLFQVATMATRGQGGVVATYPAGVSLQASVQPQGVTRLGEQGNIIAKTVYHVMTDFDPVVKTDDRFIWQGKNLYALGPAEDQGGRGAAYVTTCEQRV